MAYPKGKPRPPGSGRAAGTPNKVTTDLKAMILGALEEAGGSEYLVEQAQKNPNAFLGLVGRTLPKDMKVDLLGKLSVHLDGRGPVGS